MGFFVTETKVILLWLYLCLTMCPLIPLWKPGISTAILTLLMPLIFCHLHQSSAAIFLSSHLGDLQTHKCLKFSSVVLPLSFLPTGEMALKEWLTLGTTTVQESLWISLQEMFLFSLSFPVWRGSGKRDRFALCNIFSLKKKKTQNKTCRLHDSI